VEIEILYIANCPHSAEAVDQVNAALTATGHPDVPVTTRLISNQEDAASVPFAGSPTILIDGEDAVPEAPATHGLACRTYRVPDGMSGTPGTDRLIEAMRNHQ